MAKIFIYRTRNILDLNKFNDDVKTALTKVIIVMKEGDDQLRFQLSSALTTAEDSQLDDLVTDFVDTDPEQKIPKIVDIAKAEAKSKHFHNIDYRKEIEGSLFPKRTKVQGEVTKVEWYRDKGLSDLFLRVDINYTRDSIGTALERETTRTWINRDGSENPETKVTEKSYIINQEDQTAEGKRRRENIVNGLEFPVLAMMMEVLLPTGLNQTAVLLKGKAFLDAFEGEFDRFIKNSSDITDPLSEDFGKKSVVVAIEGAPATTYDWLDELPNSLGGLKTIRQYLIEEFSI